MIKYDGMKSEEYKGNGSKYLPAGPYVAQVLKVSIEGNAPDQRLAVCMDILEGEFAGWFMKKFKAMQAKQDNQYPVKFKGVLRLRIPNPANPNAQYPETDIRRFNDMIWKFERSNDGFHWDGDEQKLVGKVIGISMQEDTYNGAVFTKIVRFEVADDVREGKVAVMPPKGRDQDDQPDPTPAPIVDRKSGYQQVQTDELPFE